MKVIETIKRNLNLKYGLFAGGIVEREEESPVLKQTKSLFISAGHSDADPGAMGGGLDGKPISEADIVLEFRDMVADHLDGLGVAFTKDGTCGSNLPLRDAIKLAKECDVAIEFHCNAFHLPSATGVETLSRSHHHSLTNKLNALISSTLGIHNRGSKGEGSGQHSRLGFISQADGIIVELFFISNPEDVRKYQEKKELLAAAVAMLLADYVREGEA